MTFFYEVARLWRTLLHLRLVQVAARVRFRIDRPKPVLTPAPQARTILAHCPAPAARAQSMTGRESFIFLNAAGTLEAGWDDPGVPKLWRYNLHYFDDLNAVGASDRRVWHAALISRWIAENPPGRGTGWEPYPTSLRIVNWVKYALSGSSLPQGFGDSLAVQARWLMRRLEWHLMGNHLFANAKALVFAGVYFDGPEAARWRDKGLSILQRELSEQVLSDGGQFELSPMYHALMVEDLLDLLALAGVAGDNALDSLTVRLRSTLPRAQRWLAAMSHPDGGISFFNDAAFAVAPSNVELSAYAERLGLETPGSLGSVHLSASGFLRLERGPAVLLADLAPIGPDYLPGHAHADTLSCELSLAGQRVIVNGGTSVYGLGAERLRQRGTQAHATVTVAGQDSSEVWSGFRVGRRARVKVEQVTTDGPVQGFFASHDGYRALRGAPRHYRRVMLAVTGLTIEDRVTGRYPAQARFPLHPDIAVETDGNGARLALPDGRFITAIASGPLRGESAHWHPEFGLELPNTCLVLDLHDGAARLEFNWAAL